MWRFVILFFALMAIPLPALADGVGEVVRVKHRVEATKEARTRTLAAHAPLHRDERLTTGAQARLEATLRDGTTLTVGEKADLVLDDLVLGTGESGLVLRLARGAFRLTSAATAKHTAKNLTVVTPLATIGLRGTDFWGGTLDGVFSVLLLDGIITITTATGTIEVSTPGTGVTIPTDTAQPSAPFTWQADRVARAVQTISF